MFMEVFFNEPRGEVARTILKVVMIVEGDNIVHPLGVDSSEAFFIKLRGRSCVS